MTWQEAIAIAVVLAGLGAGAFLVAQRPAFWMELGSRLLLAFAPILFRFIGARMPPSDEERMRECIRQGGEWDNFRKKCKGKQ